MTVSSILKYTFLLHFLVVIFFGLAYFLITDIFLAMLAWPIEVSMTRVVGAVFIGVAISSLYGFRAESWDRVEIVVLMEIVLTLFGLIAMIWNMLTILTLPLIGWAFAGLFGLFFILFLYSYLTH